ncbi:MAG: hypothetical protein BroJett030_00950 [Alphaproteobacteria bacterium]|nr:MAG: hypothetical protein BroJett030_00950 [Alphaproteobacteria bacterium]
MSGVAGISFGILGPLAAFPRRLAAREVARQHGRLRSGVTRRTTVVVFGRRLLDRVGEAEIAGRHDEQRRAGRAAISENGFLRRLGVLATPADGTLERSALIEQSRLPARDFDLLCLFDAFEHDCEPFSFRDLILAKKYAGLIAGGASWAAIARSVHRATGTVASLTALSLERQGRDAIQARLGGDLSELDGQLLLPIGRAGDDELEQCFEAAEDAEAEQRFDDAARLYERCLAIDPADAVAAFNRANCLTAAGRRAAARSAYLEALKLDAEFAEAWFNLAGLDREDGRTETARRHLERAIGVDADYADAVYNLATLEFDAGGLARARVLWARYLELDTGSDWARNAARGIRFVDLELAQRSAG